MNQDSILTLPIGTSVDYKFGIITRDVYRVSEESFEITDLSSGWHTAIATIDEMTQILSGKLSLHELNWK